MKFQYKQSTPLEKRLVEGEGMRLKYPDRCPVLIERVPQSELGDLEKKRFLLPNELTIGQMYFLLRKRLGLFANQALFIFINDVVPASCSTIGALYNEFHDDDGFLYVAYSDENIFTRR